MFASSSIRASVSPAIPPPTIPTVLWALSVVIVVGDVECRKKTGDRNLERMLRFG